MNLWTPAHDGRDSKFILDVKLPAWLSIVFWSQKALYQINISPFKYFKNYEFVKTNIDILGQKVTFQIFLVDIDSDSHIPEPRFLFFFVYCIIYRQESIGLCPVASGFVTSRPVGVLKILVLLFSESFVWICVIWQIYPCSRIPIWELNLAYQLLLGN